MENHNMQENPTDGVAAAAAAAAAAAQNYFDMIPPGHRFRPTDEELIVHYLRKKINNERLPLNQIIEYNIYLKNPQELAEEYKLSNEKEMYFFTPRQRKYKNGDRPNRAAGDGYWKATGADKTITHNGEEVGFRKALVFYMGKPPAGTKTSWIMHEYRVKNPPECQRTEKDDCMKLDDCILCRIYDNSSSTSIIRNLTQATEVQNQEVLDKNAQTLNSAVQPASMPSNQIVPSRYNDNESLNEESYKFSHQMASDYDGNDETSMGDFIPFDNQHGFVDHFQNEFIGTPQHDIAPFNPNQDMVPFGFDYSNQSTVPSVNYLSQTMVPFVHFDYLNHMQQMIGPSSSVIDQLQPHSTHNDIEPNKINNRYPYHYSSLKTEGHDQEDQVGEETKEVLGHFSAQSDISADQSHIINGWSEIPYQDPDSTTD